MERNKPSSEWGTRRSMRRSRLRWIRRSSTERCASLGSIHRSCMSVLQAVTANHVTFHAALSSASPLDPFGKGCARQMDKAVNIMSDWMNAPDSIPTSILSEVRQPLSPRSSLGPLDWVQKYRQKKGGAGNSILFMCRAGPRAVLLDGGARRVHLHGKARHRPDRRTEGTHRRLPAHSHCMVRVAFCVVHAAWCRRMGNGRDHAPWRPPASAGARSSAARSLTT